MFKIEIDISDLCVRGLFVTYSVQYWERIVGVPGLFLCIVSLCAWLGVLVYYVI